MQFSPTEVGYLPVHHRVQLQGLHYLLQATSLVHTLQEFMHRSLHEAGEHVHHLGLVHHIDLILGQFLEVVLRLTALEELYNIIPGIFLLVVAQVGLQFPGEDA